MPRIPMLGDKTGFTAGRVIQDRRRGWDEEFQVGWSCILCGRAGTVTFFRTESYSAVVYEKIDKSHHAATEGRCKSPRRLVTAPSKTGGWRDHPGHKDGVGT